MKIFKWSELFLKNGRKEMSLVKKRESSFLGLQFFVSSIYLVCVLLVIRVLKIKSLSIGDFVSIMQAVQESQRTLSEISRNIVMISNEKLYVQDVFSVLSFQDIRYDVSRGKESFPPLTKKGITVNNISFKYPYSDREILHNISFQVKPGEKVAIVGENGSGKTSLIKCIMGLYPISQGEIKYENINIKEIAEEDLLKNITVIFQDYIKYNFSLKENITLKEVENDYDLKRLESVMGKSGVIDFSSKFNEGVETKLGKIFIEGEDLSGGQWQKIAISRALYKSGEIFILDEPTSALDPKAEMEVYEKFDKLVEGKTAIFISHRMASARIADKIIVMKEGRIVEIGNHEELMMYDSEYSKIYNMQSKWFSNELVKY